MSSDPARHSGARHGRQRARGRGRRAWWLAAVPVVAVICLAAVLAWPSGSPPASRPTAAVVRSTPPGPPPPIAPEPQIVPAPARMTAGRGWFTLTARTAIVARSAAALAVARDLAADLRPATGYPLPVAAGPARSGAISLAVGNPGIQAASNGEGYKLTVTPAGATVVAQSAHGLFDAVQTIRQMLPDWIDSPVRRAGPWSMPAVQITDWPRYSYRGVMLDIARHYEPPSAVEQLISQAAAYKIDVLHLHLSDDQGFRLQITGFPRLATVGGEGSVGTDGRVMDPGGYWTQAQYRAVVADAAAHFVTLVPEVDSPGHDNAIIMSEYDDTGNPLLHGDPGDINCSVHNPPVWDHTEDVGYSAMCPDASDTWAIEGAIIGQLSAMTTGPYYDIGGDEVPTSVLSSSSYAAFVNHEAGIVASHGKTLMGWADIAGPGTKVPRGSVAEYWEPASGSAPLAVTGREAAAKGMKLVMAPANHAYLDQKYLGGARGDAPVGLGQTWACPDGCDLDAAYDWDPGTLVSGVPSGDVIGVEGAIWTETLVNLAAVDYMAFPRLLALAEVAWSPQIRRGPHSPAWRSFLTRAGAQGGRLLAAGVNFYPSTEVAWPLTVTGAALTAQPGHPVPGAVATVTAPGFAPGAVRATVHWGDGTVSHTGVTGRAPGQTQINSLYQVPGGHTYRRPGLYHGTLTVRAPGAAAATTTFTVRVS